MWNREVYVIEQVVHPSIQQQRAMMVPPRMTEVIMLKWVQKGHSTFDPCGAHLFAMTCCWTKVNKVEAAAECRRAEEYARDQGWESWEVTRHTEKV